MYQYIKAHLIDMTLTKAFHRHIVVCRAEKGPIGRVGMHDEHGTCCIAHSILIAWQYVHGDGGDKRVIQGFSRVQEEIEAFSGDGRTQGRRVYRDQLDDQLVS